ncbi:MAG: PilZ domain-containing protein [Phycisphaerales bacterium]|jgi:CheY-like chemotaxis protein
MGSRTSGPSGLHNTLNLSAEQLGMIMDDLDAAGEGGRVRRNHARLSFRIPAIEVEVYQPSGGSVNFCVACRNLSRGGLSVVHSSYMHVGTRCRIKMTHNTDGPVWIKATVVQCRHVTGRVHDVGLKFDKEIDVNDFMELDPLSDNFSLETVEAKKLEGRVLLVTASDIDRKLIEAYLSDTSLRMIHVEGYEEILGQFSEPFDAVLCDFDKDVGAASEAVRGLRSAGHGVPVIAFAGDISDGDKALIRESRASALLRKPIDKSLILKALAEFILLGRGAGENLPAPAAKQETDPSLKALADLFAKDLVKFADEITQATQSGDEKNLRYICARIRGTGPLLGHGAVADAAGRVLASLDAEEGSIETSTEAINALTSMCRLVRAA